MDLKDEALAKRVKQTSQRVKKDGKKMAQIEAKLRNQIDRGERLAVWSDRLLTESALFWTSKDFKKLSFP